MTMPSMGSVGENLTRAAEVTNEEIQVLGGLSDQLERIAAVTEPAAETIADAVMGQEELADRNKHIGYLATELQVQLDRTFGTANDLLLAIMDTRGAVQPPHRNLRQAASVVASVADSYEPGAVASISGQATRSSELADEATRVYVAELGDEDPVPMAVEHQRNVEGTVTRILPEAMNRTEMLTRLLVRASMKYSDQDTGLAELAAIADRLVVTLGGTLDPSESLAAKAQALENEQREMAGVLKAVTDKSDESSQALRRFTKRVEALRHEASQVHGAVCDRIRRIFG